MANKYTATTYITETHAECRSCLQIKPHKDFHKDKKNIHRLGLTYYCKSCACLKARDSYKNRMEINK